VDEDIRLLHLTDLHLGKGQERPDDVKSTIPYAERRKIVERLGDYLRALPERPTFVCVTGDVTNRGDPGGFDEFMEWVEPLIVDGVLPKSERFLITPGNHDVQRADDMASRFAAFYGLARAFPHAHIPGHDPEPSDNPKFDGTATFAGGVYTRKALGKVEVRRNEPFLFDRDARLLLFAFNSSLACGVYPRESQEMLDEVDKALDLAEDDTALKRQVTKLRERAANDLLVDAGLVGDDQLRYFERVMQKARDALGADWSRITKIALLHHHVNPIWRQQLELKPFESIIDAAQLKQALTAFRFDIVLHGHKHQNGVSLDARVVPTTDGRSPDPVAIVSGGTVCGLPAPDDRRTFKVLRFKRLGTRESASVTEFPLLETADPAEAMRSEGRQYQLPLADRIPELHDDERLKHVIDKKLLEDAIPTNPPPSARTDGGDTSLLGDAELVAQTARYKFASVVHTQTRRLYFDVFLAASRLDFRQRARIYWMLSDVKRSESSDGIKPGVCVVIGNLAATNFSRERTPGEISTSVQVLKDWFAPALDSELLQVIECKLVQGDLDALAQSIPAGLR
jgi:3',5'-cyclic AMP phosphodiesterase CpdA